MLIDTPEKLTPAVLTEVLRADGALKSGVVTAIERDASAPGHGLVSNIARLRLTYSAEAPNSLPNRLFLKTSRPGMHPEIAAYEKHEVDFYQLAAQQHGALPAPHCYKAGFDDETSNAYVLLDDLSETHVQRPLPLPPSNRGCELIVETLADLHAYF